MASHLVKPKGEFTFLYENKVVKIVGLSWLSMRSSDDPV